MKILITGGAGFIGSHLVDKLVDSHELTVLDNLSTGKLENLQSHLEREEIIFIRGDITSTETVRRAVKDIDVIIHLAALTSVPESIRKPLTYNKVNATATLKLVRQAVKSKVKQIIFSSSAAVYGNPIHLPIKESHPLKPLSPYAASKIAAENYLKTYSSLHGIKTTILRIFNAYGPRQTLNQYSGVITIFINNALKGKPLKIFGDGNQVRDFIYIEDVVEAFKLALEANRTATYNIATGKPTKIITLAKTVKQLTQAKSKIIYTKPRKGDIRYSYADITKAKNQLGFQPKTTLKEGLRKTIESWGKLVSRVM